jgi:hypothetical protein
MSSSEISSGDRINDRIIDRKLNEGQFCAIYLLATVQIRQSKIAIITKVKRKAPVF